MPSIAEQAVVAERRAEVLRMRVGAVPVSVIAKKFGVSESTIHVDVTRALEARSKTLDAATAEYRSMDLEKLEAMERAAWQVMHRKHVHVSASGKVARHPDTDEIIHDDGPTLQAIATLLRVQERRAKLLGLDAVVTAKLEVKQVETDVDSRIARLMADMAASGPREAPSGIEVLSVAPASETGPAPS